MTGILWLVANRASGSNSDEAVRAVCAALSAAGRAPARVSDMGEGLPDRAALEAGGVGVLAVFAGDGTVNALATRI